MKIQPDNPLPREIAPGVFWLGQCSGVMYEGRMLHSYSSAFLVVGEKRTALIEAGLTSDAPMIERQLDSLLQAGVRAPSHLFVTHGEIPHAGGIGRLLARFPDAVACGDMTDLHMVFPEYADRLRHLAPGDVVDLGGTELRVIDAVFRDLVTTCWLFDTRRKVLFAADGFAYSHLHAEGHCGHLGEETLDTLELAEHVAFFAQAAFHWTEYVDIEPYIDRLERLLFEELDVAVVAPSHGLPFSDLVRVVPGIKEGLRLGSTRGAAAR